MRNHLPFSLHMSPKIRLCGTILPLFFFWLTNKYHWSHWSNTTFMPLQIIHWSVLLGVGNRFLSHNFSNTGLKLYFPSYVYLYVSIIDITYSAQQYINLLKKNYKQYYRTNKSIFSTEILFLHPLMLHLHITP